MRTEGDAHARSQVRMEEIRNSLALLLSALMPCRKDRSRPRLHCLLEAKDCRVFNRIVARRIAAHAQRYVFPER